MAPTKAQLTAQLNALIEKTNTDLAAVSAAYGVNTAPISNASATAPGPISTGTYLSTPVAPTPAPTPAPVAVEDISSEDLGTLNTAMSTIPASSSGSGGSTGPTVPTGTKKAINSIITTINGRQVQIITYDDGTTQQIDLGSSVDPVQQRNAIAALTATFQAYGLTGDIATAITEMVQQGYSADTIALIAQDPNSTSPLALAMQARFPANKARLAVGLPPLDPATYIATEKSYRQIMNAAGLPKGFYDSTSDFTNLISKDISATELKGRVDLAAAAVANADPIYTNQLQTMYGLSTGDMIAHLLDPSAALPLLQKQAAAVQIGTAAARQGFGVSTTAAESLYGQGVTQAQAEVGFKNIMQNITPAQKIAATWGGDAAVQGQNLVASTFGTAGAAYAEQQLQALARTESAAFQGSSGISKGSLGTTAAEAAGGAY